MATLTGKKALVLGGSRGIGAAIVERLAKEGAITTFTHGGSKGAAKTLAEKTHTTTLQADSADRVAVSKLIANQGPLDILPFPGGAAYGMTKSAVQGMVRGLARDFGDRNITVNSVQPGPVNTDLNPEDGPMKDMMHSFMAIKRHAQPTEIAGMVAYLVGPEASIVTGAQHTIDGGFGA